MVFEKVRNLIAQQLNVDGEEITRDSRFVEDLSADSIDIVELMMAVEDEFGLEMTDESAMEGMKTVGDVVNYISEHI